MPGLASEAGTSAGFNGRLWHGGGSRSICEGEIGAVTTVLIVVKGNQVEHAGEIAKVDPLGEVLRDAEILHAVFHVGVVSTISTDRPAAAHDAVNRPKAACDWIRDHPRVVGRDWLREVDETRDVDR